MVKKKGFALASVIVMMAVVMAVTTLVIILVNSMNLYSRTAEKKLSTDFEILQVEENFKILSVENFIALYVDLGYEKISTEGKLTITKLNEKYSFKITEGEFESTCEILKNNAIFEIISKDSEGNIIRILKN